MKYRYFIGLDVGGTFTKGTIIDVEDNLRYNVKDVGANPAIMPREKVIEIISHIIRELINRVQGRSSEVACIGVGSTGVGKGYWRDLFVKAAEKMVLATIGHVFMKITGLFITLVFLLQPGILYIAGTGSVNYGVYGGKEVKVD